MKTLIDKVILEILKTLRSPFPLLDIKFMIMQQRFVFKLSVLVTCQNKISRIYYWIRIDFLLNVMIFQGQFLKPIINIRLFFSKVSAFFSISSYFRPFMHRFSFSISLVSISLSLSLSLSPPVCLSLSLICNCECLNSISAYLSRIDNSRRLRFYLLLCHEQNIKIIKRQ